MLKPHLRPPLDPLNTIHYTINEAQYSDFQVNDPFAKDFNTKAAVIHQHVKTALNPGSCDKIMQLDGTAYVPTHRDRSAVAQVHPLWRPSVLERHPGALLVLLKH
eukprot:UN4001